MEAVSLHRPGPAFLNTFMELISLQPYKSLPLQLVHRGRILAPCRENAIPCDDIVSMHEWVLEYAVHERHILAGGGPNPFMDPISSHETPEKLHGAPIWPP
jgi:hypothetical protein